MADTKKGNKGKNGTKKYGRNAEKCAAYAAAHHIKAGKKRFSDSKEHRQCGPLGYYARNGDGKKLIHEKKIVDPVPQDYYVW